MICSSMDDISLGVCLTVIANLDAHCADSCVGYSSIKVYLCRIILGYGDAQKDIKG